MTEPLYYQDPYLFEFQARILRRLTGDQGYGLVLDRTAFYPGGGGQPPDRGAIEDLPLLAITRDGDTPVHWVAQDPGKERVHCRVDALRRLDNMQQHTGQHLISACLLKVGGFETVSVHFGEQYTAVEIDREAIAGEQIQQAEALANRIVAEARLVETYWLSPEEIHRIPLRKKPPAREKIRIVEIDGLDWSACGGTHVRKTSEVGPVVFAGSEKIRGRMRLRWLIGDRVRAAYHRQREWLHQMSVQLTSAAEELPERIARLLEERKALARQVHFLNTRLGELLADSLSSKAQPVGRWQLVHFNAGTEFGPDFLRPLMQRLIARPGLVAVLACQNDAASAFWMVGASEDCRLDFARLLPPLLPIMGDARGGGRGTVWQGKCSGTPKLEAFVRALKARLSEGESHG
ncbi:MAG: alanyl-tRNA editing protein [Calditrichaeota bacterium]|nr:MAG: alanyl-tRNA editing protein [Calditrichota bacterium]